LLIGLECIVLPGLEPDDDDGDEEEEDEDEEDEDDEEEEVDDDEGALEYPPVVGINTNPSSNILINTEAIFLESSIPL
jgi:hypothetical protein